MQITFKTNICDPKVSQNCQPHFKHYFKNYIYQFIFELVPSNHDTSTAPTIALSQYTETQALEQLLHQIEETSNKSVGFFQIYQKKSFRTVISLNVW